MSEIAAFFERFNALHPKKIDLSLGRMQTILAVLGHPERHLPPTIHVAGTNGKGSTVAFLRAMLEASGKRVHVYTSPHLVRFHERIRLAGELVSDAQLISAFDTCEKANAGAPITVFEMTTAAAFLLFSQVPADMLLLEVGLGGRLDATNVIDAPLASIITPVSLDHPEFLGTDLAVIAAEKSGIIKRKCPLIISPQSEFTTRIIESHAAKLAAPVCVGGQDFTAREEHGRFVYEDEIGLLDLPKPHLPGAHQLGNAAAAIAALRKVFPDFPVSAIEQGLLNANWPARLQLLNEGHLLKLVPPHAELWLDGGHNADGGRVLAEALTVLQQRSARPLHLVCGMLTTKDTSGFLQNFVALKPEILAIPVGHAPESGRTPADIVDRAVALGLHATEAADLKAALAAIPSDLKPPRILICGSLYLAGEVLEQNGTIPR